MKLNNDLANKLIEKAKSEKLSLSLICFAFILWGCIEIADEWLVHFGTLLMADCCSVSVLCGYKIRCKKLKEQKYKNYRYKKILWNLILLRTLIFVPFVYWFLSQGCWLLFKISVFNFNRLEHSIFFVISWVIWCAILWSWRKFYKKIRKNSADESPTSFYNVK